MASIIPILISSVLAMASIAIVLWRANRIGRGRSVLFIAAIVALLAAACPLRWHYALRGKVEVMVDVSASTRGAAYRDQVYLQHRIGQLLGNIPFDLRYFAERDEKVAIGTVLGDWPGNYTHFAPGAADAVVLFSDGRFDADDFGGACYAVIDPNLETPADASVYAIERRGEDVAITVHVRGPGRVLHLRGVRGAGEVRVGQDMTIVRPIDPAMKRVEATFEPGDAWGENDSMSLANSPMRHSVKWWVGEGSAPAGYELIAPKNLPDAMEAYFAPRMIVLKNVSAEDVSPAGQDCLARYVSQLGGSLVIFGGTRAFGAGGYAHTALGDLSPLDSVGPESKAGWILLVDASGSMNEMAGGVSRYEQACAGMVGTLSRLPAGDRVRIGQFSDGIRWWSEGATAAETARKALPLRGAGARGPTNLQGVFDELSRGNGDVEQQLVLLTDGGAVVGNAQALGDALNARKIHLHLVAVGDGPAISTLERVAGLTGGSVESEMEATRWAMALSKAVASGLPAAVVREAREIMFEPGAAWAGGRRTGMWNRTWVKSGATVLGHSGEAPMLARWQVGLGSVVACAAGDLELEPWLESQGNAPSDPNVRVSWHLEDEEVHCEIDAHDERSYFNDRRFVLQVGEREIAFAQTGPGLYGAGMAMPDGEAIATVKEGDAVVDQVELPRRYAREFNSVGNDWNALGALVEAHGGKVIEPTWQKPIGFKWPEQTVDGRPWLAGLGALFVGMGLLIRRGR